MLGIKEVTAEVWRGIRYGLCECVCVRVCVRVNKISLEIGYGV